MLIFIAATGNGLPSNYLYEELFTHEMMTGLC
jgi:hypothetical protein